jgi:hypothetical protein
LLRALGALLILLALGWPLSRMLNAVAEAPPPADPKVAAATPAPAPDRQTVHLQVSFTTPPTQFRLLSLGVEVWKDEAPGLEIERDLALAFPKEGVDLEFQIAWPAETRAAARVRLTDPQGGGHEKLVWGTGPTTEVLTFP